MGNKEIKRKIAVIFATDVIDYSKSIEIDEEQTIKDLRICKQILKDLFKEHGGRIFNTAGDSVLAEFSSAVSAVICASEFQKLIKERNNSPINKSKMEFRIGINMGDVVVENENLYGDGVNIATRLESLAQPNGICISNSVYEFINKKIDLLFNDLGNQKVKNNEFHAYDVIIDTATNRVEKKQIQSRLGLFILVIVLFFIGLGYYYNFWDLLSSHKKHVLYIGSLEETIELVKNFPSVKDAMIENSKAEILCLNEEEINEVSSIIQSNLLNVFYNQNTHIEILNDNDEKSYIFVKNIVKHKNVFSIDINGSKISTYDYFDQPDQLGFIFIYKIKIKDSVKFLAVAFGFVGDPQRGNNWNYELELEDKDKFISYLDKMLSRQIKHVNNKQRAGYVTQIDDNIIIINPNDLNLKKHMTVNGSTRYILKDKNENGKIDLDEGLKKLLDDINRAIKYIEDHPNEYTEAILNDFHEMYKKWSNFNGIADMTMSDQFGYNLKIVDVNESKIVAKVISLNHPWVKIRQGDKITP